MKKKLLIVVGMAAVASSVLFSGCNSKRNLVGVWIDPQTGRVTSIENNTGSVVEIDTSSSSIGRVVVVTIRAR